MQEPTQPCAAKHDPRDCRLCRFLRHPAQAAQGRTLQRYLSIFPLPKQGANA